MPTQVTVTVNSLEGNNSIKVIHVTGELDESNLGRFEEVVDPLVQQEGIKVLIFNLMGLKFMNSKVIGYFAYLYSTLSKNKRRIIFASYNKAIRDVLALVGLDRLVESQVTLEDAIQAAYKMLRG